MNDSGWRVRKDGARFYASTEIAVLRDQTGKLAGFSYLICDLSDEKAAEESLRQARDQAEEASRAKSRFLANMSHEIRTPMNGILGITDILLRTELSEKQRQLVSTLKEVGSSLLAVINDILDLSRVEAGKLPVQAEEFSIKELIGGIKELFAGEVSDSKNILEFAISPLLPAIVVGDAGRLRQVLINLTGNALKFTRHGSVKLGCRICPNHRN